MTRRSRGDEDDFRRLAYSRNIRRFGVTNGDRRSGAYQHVRERPPDGSTSADHDDLFAPEFGFGLGEDDTGCLLYTSVGSRRARSS